MSEESTPEISAAARELLERPNQLIRPLLSVIGMSPFPGNDTSPRKQMMSGNLGAFQVIKGATERFIQTGMEREYGKYTFNVKAPDDIRILKIIDRYPRTAGLNSIALNPQTIVIYEEIKTKIVGCISIENYKTNHPYFGFVYRPGEAYSKLKQGMEISKGEVFLESPNITKTGGYKYGGEFKVAKMTLPACSEDGIVASKSAMKRFAYYTFEKRIIECDASMVPLNLYPDDNRGQYGVCPDIGNPVRADGLVAALRPYNEDTSIYDMSKHGLREYQEGYDKAFKAPPGGKVVDIQVHRNPLMRQPRVPFGMDDQLMKYLLADRTFHEEILMEYNRLKRLRRDALQLTPEFHALVTYAHFPTETDEAKMVAPYHRKAKINDWRIEITIQYLNIPDVGFKVTGLFGDKGTIVKVVDDEDMPIDDFGNRAELAVDPLATVSRSILGREYEHKFNAVFRDVVKEIHNALGTNEAICDKARLAVLNRDGLVRAQYLRLVEMYKIVSPDYMGVTYTETLSDAEMYEHMHSVLSGNRMLFIPPETNKRHDISVNELDAIMPDKVSPVTYRGNSGRLVRTVENVRIASSYIVALDKPGDDWAAINSGRLQHYGILARINSATKYTMAIRHQPTQVFGETEFRILVSLAAPYVAAELIDRNYSRNTMEEVVRRFLTHPNPANIDVIIDRNKIPYGESRPLQISRHINEGYGFRTVYKPYVPTWEKQTS